MYWHPVASMYPFQCRSENHAWFCVLTTMLVSLSSSLYPSLSSFCLSLSQSASQISSDRQRLGQNNNHLRYSRTSSTKNSNIVKGSLLDPKRVVISFHPDDSLQQFPFLFTFANIILILSKQIHIYIYVLEETTFFINTYTASSQ